MNIQNIYDNNIFFNNYQIMRESKINANELLEIPTMKKLLPNLNNKSILELGCGAGQMARYFVKNGAKKVLATDISSNMINEAKTKNCKNINYQILAMENLNNITEKFDIVYSSLAFHYVKDFNKLIKDISNCLKKGGQLIFSQEHPLTTCTILQKDMPKHIEIENKRYYYLSDYNNNSKRFVNWNIDGVTKYHRNFETIINTLIKNNLQIEEIKESKASKNAIKKVPKYVYQQDKPYFLFIKAIKV